MQICRRDTEQHVLEYATARTPKANAHRDRALCEIADWLMDIGRRYWIATPGVRGSEIPLQDFTQRIVQLQMAMCLPSAVPSWVDCRDDFLVGLTTLEIAKFGSRKVPAKCAQDSADKGTCRQNTDLNLYYKTLLCDFKAIHRYLKRKISTKARRWLARLSAAVEAPAIGALLQMGGPSAWTALTVVLWWRAVRAQGFDSKASLACRPYWLALDPAIPAWGGQSQSNPALKPGPDLAHLWLVRWISAAGLLSFWRSVRDDVARQSHHQFSAGDIRVSASSLETRWCLGISATDVLTLCITNGAPGVLVHAGTLS
jgi:hypothetical protein